MDKLILPTPGDVQIILDDHDLIDSIVAVHNHAANTIEALEDDLLLGLSCMADDDIVERTKGALHHLQCAIELLRPGFIDNVVAVQKALAAIKLAQDEREAASIMHL